MPSLNNVSLDFKVFDCPSKEEKINQFKMLISDLRILKRLDRIEAEIEKRKTGGKL
jgi:hypothetical protein